MLGSLVSYEIGIISAISEKGSDGEVQFDSKEVL